MRKLVSIALAFLFLLANMHVSVATHYCGGEIAATRVSLSKKTATCGMEIDNQVINHTKTHISSNCCQDEMAIYAVESDFTQAEFQLNHLNQKALYSYYTPEAILLHAITPLSLIPANVSPPGRFPSNAVNLSGICVFRI